MASRSSSKATGSKSTSKSTTTKSTTTKVDTSNQGKWGNSPGWDLVGGGSQTPTSSKSTTTSKPSSSSSSSSSSSHSSNSGSSGGNPASPNMSRRMDLAGQTVQDGMYQYKYDSDGYAQSATKTSNSAGYVVNGTTYNGNNQVVTNGANVHSGGSTPTTTTGATATTGSTVPTSDVGKTNNAADLQALISGNPDGSAVEAVKAALAARNQKITSNPTIYGKNINGIYVGDSVTQQALNYINGYSNTFTPQTTVGNTMGQATVPDLAGTDKLGDLYGITYDQNTIRDILNRATEAEYAAKDQAFGTTENKYINQAQTDQATTLNSLQKANQQASVNNAMMGANSANALSAILSGQQLNATNMLDLANQRNLLQSQKTAALSANASTALTDSNSIKQAIASIDLSKYGYDTQKMVGQMDYLAALNDALAQIKSSQTAADATKYASDNDLAGTKYNSDSYSKNTGGRGTYTPTYGSGSGSGAGNTNNSGSTGTGAGTGTTTPAGNTATGATVRPIEGISGATYKEDANGKVTVSANGKTSTVNSSQLAVMQREGSVDAGIDPDKYSYDMMTNQLFQQASSGVPYAQSLWSGLKGVKNKTLDNCTITLGNGNKYTYNKGQATWTSSATKQQLSTKSMLGVLTTGALSTGASISTK